MVSYINQQGGTTSRSLCELAIKIWDLCITNNIVPLAMHMSGVHSIAVDTLRRQISSIDEWELNYQFSLPIFYLWGCPDINIFMTRENSKVQELLQQGRQRSSIIGRQVSPGLDTAISVHFFSTPADTQGNLETTALTAYVILVAPWWPHQNWFQMLLHFSTGHITDFLLFRIS